MMRRYRQAVLSASLLLLTGMICFLAVPVHAADDETSESELENLDAAALSDRPVETYRYTTASAGYRFVSPDGVTIAAEPYSRLRSGVAGGFSAGTLGSDLKLTVEGFALNEDDYHADLLFDYSGYFRLRLESEALWHNLLTERLPPTAPGQYTANQSDPAGGFGVRTSISQMENRIKVGNNPIHINLGYWELRREGTEQLRFSDHDFPNAATNSINSVANRVDRITREGRVGIDAHLHYFDIAYDFRIRDFSNEAADYRYPFSVNVGGPGFSLTPGMQATNVISDSRVTSHTIKLYSDMSGGLVGTAAYSLTQRENSTDHGDASPSSQPADMLQSVAGDLTYTPFKELSFALKYRRLQIDRDSPATVFYPYSQIPTLPTINAPIPPVYTATPGTLLVKPAIDTVKDTLSLSGTFRPNLQSTYRFEYRAILESRDNILSNQASVGSVTDLHSENRQTHMGTAYASWRPSPGLRLNASYTYSSTINPDWAASSTDSHKGELFLTYARNGSWGTTASFIATYESGERRISTDPAVPAPDTYVLPRKQRSDSANASFWFSPLERLTITANYSYLGTDSDQSVLFSALIADPSPVVATNYRSTAHVYGIDAMYALSEDLDLSLAFQQVFSTSRFDVPGRAFPVTGSYDTYGITELTRLDTTETGVTTRADWHITKHVGCSLNYGYRSYNSGNPLFDGSVHTAMLLLTSRW